MRAGTSGVCMCLGYVCIFVQLSRIGTLAARICFEVRECTGARISLAALSLSVSAFFSMDSRLLRGRYSHGDKK